jgi:hypothetical protein
LLAPVGSPAIATGPTTTAVIYGRDAERAQGIGSRAELTRLEL